MPVIKVNLFTLRGKKLFKKVVFRKEKKNYIIIKLIDFSAHLISRKPGK